MLMFCYLPVKNAIAEVQTTLEATISALEVDDIGRKVVSKTEDAELTLA